MQRDAAAALGVPERRRVRAELVFPRGARERDAVHRRVRSGARDMARPDVMGLASLRLEIGVICDFLYSVLLLNAILRLGCLRLAPSRPQVRSVAVRPRSCAERLPGRGDAVLIHARSS